MNKRKTSHDHTVPCEGLFETIRRLQAESSTDEETSDLIWEAYGRRCAVVVIDSTGFTVGTRTAGIIGFLSCIARLRDLAGAIFERRGCIRWRYAADNLYAQFSTARDALAAAVEIRDAVKSERILVTKDCPVDVCTGIGYGDVLDCGEEGVFGDEMNLASKLGEDIAGRGEILLTRSAWSSLPSELRDDFEKRVTEISGIEFEYHIMKEVRP